MSKKKRVAVPVCRARGCENPLVLKGLRGLCVACFADPLVRVKSKPVKAAVVTAARKRRKARPLPVPTDIPPGPLKAAVIEMRVRLGQALWHELDAKA